MDASIPSLRASLLREMEEYGWKAYKIEGFRPMFLSNVDATVIAEPTRGVNKGRIVRASLRKSLHAQDNRWHWRDVQALEPTEELSYTGAEVLRENPKKKPKLKTFSVGRRLERWRSATRSLPSSEHDRLWIGYTLVPASVQVAGDLDELTALSVALEPDHKEGRWPQYVAIARTDLHPALWRRYLGKQWKGPNLDNFSWHRVKRGVNYSGASEGSLRELKPGEAKYRVHQHFNYKVRSNPGRRSWIYGSVPPRGWAEAELRKNGIYDFTFVREDTHPKRGPVLIYASPKYRINVGRRKRSDLLDVRMARKARRNVGVLSEWDPREWQLHAQTLEIFKQGLKGSLRGNVMKGPEHMRAMTGRAFGITVGRAQKYGWVIPGTKTPTERTAEASRRRYEGTYVNSKGERRDLDALLNGRQDYEVMLAGARVGGDFYRVTEEPTVKGKRWFVWPLQPGQRTPTPLSTKQEADRLAEGLNRSADPRGTGKWRGRTRGVTAADLAEWLPPAGAFETFSSSVAPKKPRRARRKVSRRSKSTTQPKPAIAPKGEIREGRLVYFLVNETGRQISPEYEDFMACWAEAQKRVS